METLRRDGVAEVLHDNDPDGLARESASLCRSIQEQADLSCYATFRQPWREPFSALPAPLYFAENPYDLGARPAFAAGRPCAVRQRRARAGLPEAVP